MEKTRGVRPKPAGAERERSGGPHAAPLVAFLYASICLIWGSTWLAVKIGLRGMPPFLGAGLRFLLATAILGAVLASRRARIRLDRDDVVCILSLGLLVFFVDYACIYWAEQYITSGLTALLFSTMPLMTALLSRFWTRTETLGPRKAAGIVIAIAGTAVLFRPGEAVGARQAVGMLLTLIASLAAAANLVMMKRHGRRGDAEVHNALGMGLGAACLLTLSALTESWSAVAWSRASALSILYLAVFGSVLAFSAYHHLIKALDATVVSLSTLIIPIVAVALGAAFLGESVTPSTLVGIATILGGVAFSLGPIKKKAAVAPPTA